jgi:hypothetical protein
VAKGRPSKFTQAIADQICERLAAGETLRSICEVEGMPPENTVRRWAIDVDNPFSAQYARAREVGYEKMADELLEIADDGTNDFIERSKESGDTYKVVDQEHIARSRLRVETRKWLLSKALPKVYGEKSTVDMNVIKKDVTQLTDAELEQRILAASRASGAAPKANGKEKPH